MNLASDPVFTKDGQAFSTKDFRYVNDDLLAVMDLPLVAGDKSALHLPGNAIISQSEAVKRYGTENVLGRTMSLISKGVTRDFRITGVMRDIPKNSQFRANAIIRNLALFA